ncbi:MAG: type IV pili methyl-accepting chemotaxis transducer N-terminal domain-containing protein [Pseudomonadota bacterium]
MLQLPVSRRGCQCLGAILTVLASLAAGERPVQAQTAKDARLSIAERIVAAGRQRMLAEGMAASLCYVDQGVADARSRSQLYVMWNIFGWYHRAIVSGSQELDLGVELDPRVLAAWQEVDSLWTELRPLYDTPISGQPAQPSQFDDAVAITRDVTEAATDLVATLRSVYAARLGPQGFGSALLIDLYERQRMLAQRIAKDVCLVARGDARPERLADLTRTVEIFSLSLDAFQNGLSDAGVPPPPTDAIAQSLRNAGTHWRPVAALAYAAAQGMELDRSGLAEFSDAMDRFISHMTGAINALATLKSDGG